MFEIYNSSTDYETSILARQEWEGDDCATCPYRGAKTCENQCEEVQELYNPYLFRYDQYKKH